MRYIVYHTHAGPAKNPPWADLSDIVNVADTQIEAEMLRHQEGLKQAGKSGWSSLGIHPMRDEEWREIERERKGD